MQPPKLAVGLDGTVVALWEFCLLAGECQIDANVLPPGGIWGSDTTLSQVYTNVRVEGLGVWPNGDAMAVWVEWDGNRPMESDQRLYWSMRTLLDGWGVPGEGQLGEWLDNIHDAALGLGDNHSAALVWNVLDTSQLLGEDYGIYAVTRPSAGSWGAPALISNWSEYFNFSDDDLIVGGDGKPVAAVWATKRSSYPSDAVLYSEVIEFQYENSLYLPLVSR
jgi:hypothetical protein